MDIFVFAVRFLLLGISSFLIGSTLYLALQYWKASKKSVSLFAVQPLYILFFMLSYSTLVVYTTVTLYQVVESGPDSFTWRVYPLTIAYLLGLAAIIKISRYRGPVEEIEKDILE